MYTERSIFVIAVRCIISAIAYDMNVIYIHCYFVIHKFDTIVYRKLNQ